jgi:hypothetical protein
VSVLGCNPNKVLVLSTIPESAQIIAPTQEQVFGSPACTQMSSKAGFLLAYKKQERTIPTVPTHNIQSTTTNTQQPTIKNATINMRYYLFAFLVDGVQ